MSPEKWKGWSVYMSNFPDANVRGCEGDPGEQGYWNFKQIGSTNKYLVSPKKWPNWYMYMQKNFTGNVKGCEGEPGPEGRWIITQYGTVMLVASPCLHIPSEMKSGATGTCAWTMVLQAT